MPCTGNTNWNNIPNTHADARPVEYRRVLDVLAIRIVEGAFRNAEVAGVFEIADIAEPFDIHDGNLRVQVKCCWFERKPPTSWAHITLNGQWELLRNYTGEVVDNIALN